MQGGCDARGEESVGHANLVVIVKACQRRLPMEGKGHGRLVCICTMMQQVCQLDSKCMLPTRPAQQQQKLEMALGEPVHDIHHYTQNVSPSLANSALGCSNGRLTCGRAWSRASKLLCIRHSSEAQQKPNQDLHVSFVFGLW